MARCGNQENDKGKSRKFDGHFVHIKQNRWGIWSGKERVSNP